VKPQPRLTCAVENIPTRLHGFRNWVLWRAEWNAKAERWEKIPVNPLTGGNASSTDPSTWSDFPTVIDAALRLKLGIGFIVTLETGLVFGDLDHCIDPASGRLTPEAAEIVNLINSYAEISPGGEGLRFIVEAKKPGTLCKRGWIELYDRARLLTITGAHLPGTPTTIELRLAELDALYERVFADKEHARATKTTAGNGRSLADHELLERAFKARNGDKLRGLLDGDLNGYPSASEADSAAAFLLAFWTQDFEQILRIIRGSRLNREKWQRADYAERTIGAALANVRETYSGAKTAAEDNTTATANGRTLVEVVEAFQRWLHMPDPVVLYVVLGAVAANRMHGDPVWPLTVGPPGSGKTELINALARLPHVHHISTLTEAALLSGTPKKDKASDTKGGLLRVIGDFGIIVAKDFTSVLSMHRDSRSALLAALREIYDGHWERGVGVDGGRVLSWDGKVGLIAGCTPAIDTHHGVMATMGERFVFCRLPAVDPTAQALRALAHVGREAQMRHELADAVAGLFGGLTIPEAPMPISEPQQRRLAALASLAVRCRSAVDRDGYRREIELVPDPEAPARLACVLSQLHAGMLVVGTDPAVAWNAIVKCAFDSMPQTRRKVFELLRTAAEPLDTTAVASTIGYPTATAQRACEDLTAHGIVIRQTNGKARRISGCCRIGRGSSTRRRPLPKCRRSHTKRPLPKCQEQNAPSLLITPNIFETTFRKNPLSVASLTMRGRTYERPQARGFADFRPHGRCVA
jgi:hypothetical protein